MHAGRALAERGLFLAHAMAQALGGRYGVSHGAMNALCLPPALRFNQPACPMRSPPSREALGTDDPPGRVEELARLGGFERLRDHGVPEADSRGRRGDRARVRRARANPRSVSPADVESLLRSIW